MSTPVLDEPEVYGSQMPRFWTVPPRHVTTDPRCRLCGGEVAKDYSPGTGCGEFQALDVLEWAADAAGYDPDPWQKWVLANSLGTAPDGTWAASDVGLIVPRQNGKGTILEIRELGGLFVLGEELIIHTAHEFKTAAEHFRRVRSVFDNYDKLRRRVKAISGSHGEEAIELKAEPTIIIGAGGKHVTKRVGGRLRFLARSKGSGRGFSCDCLVYDEAMILTPEQVGASLPTMSARPNPQIWYAGSSGLKDSFQLATIRRRILKDSRDLFGAEWSVSPHDDACPRDEIAGRPTNDFIVCGKHDDRDRPKSWARANPGYGYRISEKFTRQTELANLPHDEFDRERLGIGEWPAEEESWSVISEPAWTKLVNEKPGMPVQPIAFAFDVDEDGRSATISAAWDHQEKRVVLEIPKGCSRQGSSWVVERVDEMVRKWHPVAIGVSKSGPAAALIPDGKKLWRERLVEIGAAEEAAAFAWFMQQVREERMWHFGKAGSPTLWHAVATADTRLVGDGGKAWSRRDSLTDITPITSATLAAYILNKFRRSYNLLDSIA